ncbi:MAG TPA: polysaccharide deacetylase [Phenylobacterium sp.]
MRHLGLWLELRRWRAAGRRARLWWRDDDAAGPWPSLDRLLAASTAADVPLTLAVVPSGDMRALAVRLTRAPLVVAAQHGLDHLNRRKGPEAGEFPHDWTRPEVIAALRRGWSLMGPLPRTTRVFVPPWNDVHPQLPAALGAAGYAAWSASGELSELDDNPSGLSRIDVHLDLLRWRGGARFRGEGRFLRALANELRRRRLAGRWSAPIGLLTHHLDHDAAAWAFLTRFLAWSAREPALEWTALEDLIGAAADRNASAA